MIKTLPNKIASEQAVLGSILLRPKSMSEVSDLLNSDSFYNSKNSTLFGIMSDLTRLNIPVDMLSLSNELASKKINIPSSYLAELINSVPSSSNIKYYAEIVAKQKTLRDVIEMGNKITEVGFSDKYEDIPVILAELQRDLIFKSSKKIENIQQTIKKLEERTVEYKYKKAKGIDLLGISCGYKKIDRVIDGLRQGHFWVLGGYSNLGKTTLALNMVADLIKQGKRVVYYSLEMTDVDILSRLLGIMCEENGISIVKGYTKNEEKLAEVKKQIIDSGFLVKTGLAELSEMMMSMYRENATTPVDLFIVDYIQNLKVKGAKNEYETATTTAVELQLNAQRLNIPILSLSQVSNEGAKNGDTQLVASFKGSGAINASADFAMEIKIGEKNNEERIEKIRRGEKVNMKLVVVKNRHGAVGYVDLVFDGMTGIFEEAPDIFDFSA